MITLLLHLLRLLPVLFGGHRQLALENLALPQQLAVYKRMMTRPRLRPTDRLVGVALLGSGPAGGSPSSSLPPPPFYAGNGVASASTGPGSLAARTAVVRALTPRSGLSSLAWPPPTRSGAPRASMASS